jgi:hypothetical protein
MVIQIPGRSLSGETVFYIRQLIRKRIGHRPQSRQAAPLQFRDRFEVNQSMASHANLCNVHYFNFYYLTIANGSSSSKDFALKWRLD